MGWAVASALFAPGTGLAQTVDVGLKLAFYVPVGALVDTGSSANPKTHFQQRLAAAPLLGANVVVWTSSRLGFAGSIGYTPSTVAQSDTFGTHDYHSSVLLTSARVLYAFTPMLFTPRPGHREVPWSFYVGVGVGVASRSGTVWAYSSGLTSPALELNVGVRTPLGSRVVMRLDVEDYISRAQFDKGLATETAARTHNDLIISASFAFRARR